MNITPRLIINCDNFINKVLDLLYNFGRFNDNVMHVFSHSLTSEIKLIFMQHAFQLNYIKELFDVLKICQWLAKFQKPKYGNKLNEVMFLLNSFTRNNHHFNNVTFTPTSSQPFILSMLTTNRHEILTHNKSKAYDFAFFPINMFLQIVKFENQ